MTNIILITISILLLFVFLVVLLIKPLARWVELRVVKRGIERFRIEREQLEACFFDKASRLGKPRDLRWLTCDWQKDVTFAKDKDSGFLTAFVAVNISFEAVEGGDMEDVAAVGTIREAAALFHYNNGHWGTGGRALFNMSPTDALLRLQEQFTPIGFSA
ncbi:hypothetical protein MNBD_PLANCTO02-32 [hydrothermal vent metagenome]|uniref:Uncharacterized protein n=1 Tax=hydrothermal vent metagenome TaxID=652676 RepID=A0A3B1DSA4_9ZZZZ